MRGRRTPSLAIAVGAALLVPLLAPTVADAAATDVVINEIMYAPPSELDGDEFLELNNRGPHAGRPLRLVASAASRCASPPARRSPPNGYLVVARDAAGSTRPTASRADAVYTGGLSNGGETITLQGRRRRDHRHRHLRRPRALAGHARRARRLARADRRHRRQQRLRQLGRLDGHLAQHAAARQLGRRRRRSGRTSPTWSPTRPIPHANQAVTVTATITGQTTAVVRYRIDFGAEQTVAMSLAGGDSYTATLPGVAAGHLLRYRVEATNAARTSRVPRVDDTIGWQGVVARNGVTSAVPMLEWFIADADYNAILGNPTADIIRQAVLSYNGTVIDNVVGQHPRRRTRRTAPSRTGSSRCRATTPLDFAGLLAEPVDEFAMQADFSDVARPARPWRGTPTSAPASSNTQLFPCGPRRTPQFLGLYTYMDLFDGTWRDREGYDDKQFFKSETSAFDATSPLVDVRWEKKNPATGTSRRCSGFLAGLALTGNAQRDYLLANADIPQMINYAAVTAIVQHVDSSSKNFYFAQDPDTGRWDGHPVGPRPHVRQRLLQRQQQLRDPGRAGRQAERADDRDPRRARVARHVLPPAAHAGQRHPGPGAARGASTTRRSARPSP